MKKGLQEVLEAFLRDGRTWVDLAIVTGIETDPDFGYLLDLECKPDGAKVQARLWNLSTGPTGSAAFPVEVGEEVVVLFPDAEPSKAIAFPGLPSGPAGIPEGFDNTKPVLDFENGVEVRKSLVVRSSSTANTERVLIGVDVLDDVKGLATDLLTGLVALAAIAAPVTGTAAAAALGTALNTSLPTLIGKLTAATATGKPAPPYASTKLEAEDG